MQPDQAATVLLTKDATRRTALSAGDIPGSHADIRRLARALSGVKRRIHNPKLPRRRLLCRRRVQPTRPAYGRCTITARGTRAVALWHVTRSHRPERQLRAVKSSLRHAEGANRQS